METGRESEVVQVFVSWLERHGWRVTTELAWADVLAGRGDERLVAEAKGVTSSPGLDVDTLYGQLLRRMEDSTSPRAPSSYRRSSSQPHHESPRPCAVS